MKMLINVSLTSRFTFDALRPAEFEKVLLISGFSSMFAI